jgi:hypothetical protein
VTLLTAGTSLLVAVMIALTGAWHASTAAVRARAQSAADAAALAAVAESGPVGHGLYESEARRYAELNGAELRSCLCYLGATAVQVEVELRGVTASARAVFDPDLLMPSAPADGLDPVLERAIDLLVARSNGGIHVVSGFRTRAAQDRLWEEALDRYGSDSAGKWVAPPGRSLHERGLAVDLGGDLELAADLVQALGLPLHRPLPNEPWHFELIGSRTVNA